MLLYKEKTNMCHFLRAHVKVFNICHSNFFKVKILFFSIQIILSLSSLTCVMYPKEDMLVKLFI
jgi:hypothetical protein